MVVSITRRGRVRSDTYFALVKQLPLTHIRNHEHLSEAQGMIDRLLQENLDTGGKDYLDVLTDLVESYEKRFVSIPDATEADVLRELMSAHGLSQTRLANATGISQSTISAVLSGSRSLTKAQILTLSRFFRVAPATFLPAAPDSSARA
jgi:antitoxin component HigA of HigAB toxin-antitoxin module